MRKAGSACLLAALVTVVGASGRHAGAKELTAGGLTFSDEMGGFELISVSGSGGEHDPIVIVERVFETGPLILVVRNTGAQRADDGSVHETVLIRALRKSVINATSEIWSGYGIELRQAIDVPSGYYDGLSFDQIRQLESRPPFSDVFHEHHRRLEPVDGIRFYSGMLAPDDRAALDFNLTDVTPTAEFYIVQQPEMPVARRLHPRFPVPALVLP
jgi:hypothetical protein